MDAKARYDELVDDLCARNDDVEPSQMMGMPCVKRSGKMVAGFSKNEGAMVFKLPDADAHARALALEGAHLFDPSGKGQPFKEWVVVPGAHADEWESFSQEALRPAG
ncbi:MAG TPA: hypothetical protein VM049_13400 [Gaiellaceae bacterium]|nr:hypothetical protein [Gaiellaceae bacterium]